MSHLGAQCTYTSRKMYAQYMKGRSCTFQCLSTDCIVLCTVQLCRTTAIFVLPPPEGHMCNLACGTNEIPLCPFLRVVGVAGGCVPLNGWLFSLSSKNIISFLSNDNYHPTTVMVGGQYVGNMVGNAMHIQIVVDTRYVFVGCCLCPVRYLGGAVGGTSSERSEKGGFTLTMCTICTFNVEHLYNLCIGQG